MLTPFVRSDAQGAVLAEVFLNPTQELSIAEIGRRSELLPAVSHREVTRLIDADVLTDRRDGRNRLVSVNKNHPLYLPMSEIIAATYGPVPVLRSELKAVDGIDEAFIYGSWAARYSGEPGLMPRDIDLLVIGRVTRANLYHVAARAGEKIRREVNAHRTSAEAWQLATAKSPNADGFLSTVASRPLVRIV